MLRLCPTLFNLLCLSCSKHLFLFITLCGMSQSSLEATPIRWRRNSLGKLCRKRLALSECRKPQSESFDHVICTAEMLIIHCHGRKEKEGGCSCCSAGCSDQTGIPTGKKKEQEHLPFSISFSLIIVISHHSHMTVIEIYSFPHS